MKKENIVIAVILAILIAVSFSSCSTQKSGCGSYDRWEAHTKFRG